MYKMAIRCITNENKGKLGSGYKNYRNGKEEAGGQKQEVRATPMF